MPCNVLTNAPNNVGGIRLFWGIIMRISFSRSLAFLVAFGSVFSSSYSLPGHAQSKTDGSIFVLAVDALSPEIQKATNLPISSATPLTESAFQSYRVTLPPYAGAPYAGGVSVEFEFGRYIGGGSGFVGPLPASPHPSYMTISGHTYQAQKTGPRNELMLELTQALFAEDKTGRIKLREERCHLYQKGREQASDGLSYFSLGGSCGGRDVQFVLSVIKQRKGSTEAACIEEGVRLSLALAKVEKSLADSKAATTEAKTALAKAIKERDEAKVALQKAPGVVPQSVIPYLQRIVDTLKDPNDYFIRLRRDAKKVLEDVKNAPK